MKAELLATALTRRRWRGGWDSNPRFAAPEAAVLVLARLPALKEAFSLPLIMGTTWLRNHIFRVIISINFICQTERCHEVDMFTCMKCQKREFQMTQLSKITFLAECPGCSSPFTLYSTK